MEEILQRLLEAERQGAETVKKAELAAEECIEDARREAVVLRGQLQREIDQQAKQHIADRVAQAEKRKAEALVKIESECLAMEKALRLDLPAAVDAVCKHLAGLTGDA